MSRRKKKQKQRITINPPIKAKPLRSLEDALEDTRVAFTSNYLYFPCSSLQPKVLYKDYELQEPPIWNERTLFVSCLERSDEEIIQNTYRGLTGTNEVYKNISDIDKEKIMDIMIDNFYHIHQEVKNGRSR